jgi:hypothetical protein
MSRMGLVPSTHYVDGSACGVQGGCTDHGAHTTATESAKSESSNATLIVGFTHLLAAAGPQHSQSSQVHFRIF